MQRESTLGSVDIFLEEFVEWQDSLSGDSLFDCGHYR
jgi:hypothetical protein